MPEPQTSRKAAAQVAHPAGVPNVRPLEPIPLPDLPPGLDTPALVVFVDRVQASAGPALGDAVVIVPNHVCPVVDLVASFVAVRPDGRAEHWAVDARGRSG